MNYLEDLAMRGLRARIESILDSETPQRNCSAIRGTAWIKSGYVLFKIRCKVVKICDGVWEVRYARVVQATEVACDLEVIDQITSIVGCKP
jgi:hypothetical protein